MTAIRMLDILRLLTVIAGTMLLFLIAEYAWDLWLRRRAGDGEAGSRVGLSISLFLFDAANVTGAITRFGLPAVSRWSIPIMLARFAGSVAALVVFIRTNRFNLGRSGNDRLEDFGQRYEWTINYVSIVCTVMLALELVRLA